MNYYIQDENDTIVLFDTIRENLENTLEFMPQYKGLEIQETDREIVLLNDKFVFEDEHQEEIAQKERERINALTLERDAVFHSLIVARMINEAMLKAQLEREMPETTDEEKVKKMLALNSLSNAQSFHRGHDLVNEIGEELGISSENLDLFFETGDYHYLAEQPGELDQEETSEDEPELEDEE